MGNGTEQSSIEVKIFETNHQFVKEESVDEAEIITTTISTLPRDLWSNKIEFLLSVIGYVVDLGKNSIKFLLNTSPIFLRECLAISVYVL